MTRDLHLYDFRLSIVIAGAWGLPILAVLVACSGPLTVPVTPPAKLTFKAPVSVKALRDEGVEAFCGACDIEFFAGPLKVYESDGIGVIFTGTSWYDIQGNPIFPHEAAEILRHLSHATIHGGNSTISHATVDL